MTSFIANIGVVAALVVAGLGGSAHAYLQDYTDEQIANHSRALQFQRAGNDELAASLYTVGCYDHGVVESCLNLGILYDLGRISASSSARTAELANETLQMACDGGMAAGCLLAGIHYATGDGVAQNYATAASLYRRACDGDDAAGCLRAGRYYAVGRGVAQNYATAVNFFRRACEGDEAQACTLVGNAYERGEGVAQNYTTAAYYLRRACRSDDGAGCVGLSLLYYDGNGVPQNPNEARRLLQRACALGRTAVCE
ncbi:MAG: sel1 repeat family protein [Alphaproteobacteria bacterium]|nr:sel1 repeat family protein [Alphaproteobacteria bacterium]